MTFIVPTDKAILKAWDYCAERSRSIEIVYRDADLEEEVLTRVHFNVNIEVHIIVSNETERHKGRLKI